MPTTPKISDASLERSAVTGDDGPDTLRFPRSESEPATPTNAKGVPQIDGSVPTMLPAGVLLDQLPDGAALLNHEFRILWCNRQLREFTAQSETVRNPPTGPRDVARKIRSSARLFTRRSARRRSSGPISVRCTRRSAPANWPRAASASARRRITKCRPGPSRRTGIESPNLLVVTVRDISAEVLQRQKLNAIYQAGLELGDLSLEDILQMSVDERIDLLKSKILHYTQDLLRFETVEIRLLDKSHETIGAAAGGGDGCREPPAACCGPIRKATA